MNIQAKEKTLLDAKRELYSALLEMPNSWLEEHQSDLDMIVTLSKDQIKDHFEACFNAGKGL